ncbi:hypothetical protein [Paenibacillus nanensis]|uniref:glycan biosynthesis hexose transferase WsfD n=1 Tax=Paenibacillus nanensis TaxID=393251 RepID=UPI00197E6F34|nr:hypothetical protein [Paenibacillus nanensis]
MSERSLQPAHRVKTFLRFLPPSVAAAAAAGIITIVALFIPPFIGIADNGDYYRIAYGNGLYFNAPDYTEQYFGYFVKDYGIFQYFNENAGALASSQSLFIKLSIVLNKMVYSPAVFDIRIQGAVYVLLYVAAIYLLVESLTWSIPKKQGYAIAVIAVFMFADTGYTAYFNSFYGESVVLIMAMLVMASGMLLYRNRYNDYAMLTVFVLSTLLLTTSKQQNAPVGVLAAGLTVLFVFLRKNGMYRLIASLSCLSLAAAGVLTYTLIPKEFVNINQYHAMTRGPLLLTDNPEETLKAFGISKQYAILAGSNYYETYTTISVDSPVLQEDFFNRYGFVSIMGYYISNPDKAVQMLNIAARNAFTIRPMAMGNFERSEHKGFGEQTMFFSGYSLLKMNLSPKTFGFIVIWTVTVIGLYLPSFIAALKKRNRRGMMRLPLLLTMILVGLSGIAVSIIGAGDADLAKHEFLFTVAFDLVTFVVIADLIRKQLWRQERLGGG